MRPMLAETISEENSQMIRYPVYGSPKFDGFRAFVQHGVMYSRSAKPIPNPEVQAMFRNLHGYDGELIVGQPWDVNCFGQTSRIVTSKTALVAGTVRYFVFDRWDLGQEYFVTRLSLIDPVYRVTHHLLRNAQEVLAYEAKMLAEGYEGIILRNPHAPYKFGRSTMSDQGMMKLKRFADYEGMVTDVEEMYRNTNPAKVDAQGYMDRGSKQEGMVPAGCLGNLVLDYQGQVIRVGQGFTQEMREELWKKPPIGQLAKFKCPPGGKPVSQGGTGLRPPYVFVGFRSELDV